MIGGSSDVHPTDSAEIHIADYRWFFVGGSYRESELGVFLEGSMYVEQFVPVVRTQDLPIVLVHGKGQTGTNFTGTPDGRRGWMHDFVRAGYVVYVVDQPEGGRSGHGVGVLSEPGTIARTSAGHVRDRLVGVSQVANWPRARFHTQWPGAGTQGDENFDQFYASQSESLVDGLHIQELTSSALGTLLDRIGRAIVLTHSQSGPCGWLVADARPDLVAAVIAIEPSGPPFRDVEFLGGDSDWYAYRDGWSKPWGLTRIPLTYEPPVSSPRELEPYLDDESGDQDAVPVYRIGGLPRRLPRLAGIPISIVSGQASYHAHYDYGTSEFLAACGVENDMIVLEHLGLSGNGHMMMLERNNHEIADVLLGWLRRRVGG